MSAYTEESESKLQGYTAEEYPYQAESEDYAYPTESADPYQGASDEYSLQDYDEPGEVPGEYGDKVVRTPVDRFRFSRGCSKCISLTTAAALISLVSLIWGSLELVTAHKFMSRMFAFNEVALLSAYVTYLVLVFGFLAATVCLIVGIILNKYLLVTGYVWYVSIFGCLYTITYIASVVMMIINRTPITSKMICRVIAGVGWIFLFTYFLMLVNSYRLTAFLMYGTR